MHLLSVIKFRKYQRPLQQTPERHYIERIEKLDVKNTHCVPLRQHGNGQSLPGQMTEQCGFHALVME